MGAVPIFTQDQDRALDFFCSKLGFKVLADYRIGPFRWVSVGREPGETELIVYHPIPDFNGDEFEELSRRIGTWTGIVFLTDNIYETYELWRRRGVVFAGPPERQPWGSWETRFSDFDGNQFHLAERPRPDARA
ncbi:MAG TPA: VOC family protein [bacterium]|nr:VOC family protein [bacterium]